MRIDLKYVRDTYDWNIHLFYLSSHSFNIIDIDQHRDGSISIYVNSIFSIFILDYWQVFDIAYEDYSYSFSEKVERNYGTLLFRGTTFKKFFNLF